MSKINRLGKSEDCLLWISSHCAPLSHNHIFQTRINLCPWQHFPILITHQGVFLGVHPGSISDTGPWLRSEGSCYSLSKEAALWRLLDMLE